MKLTITLIFAILAVSLARDVTFTAPNCTDTGGVNKLSNTKGEKIKIMTEKGNKCSDVSANVVIEKGDLDFYVKVGKYDKDKLNYNVAFSATPAANKVITTKDGKHQVGT